MLWLVFALVLVTFVKLLVAQRANVGCRPYLPQNGYGTVGMWRNRQIIVPGYVG
jgi:hypothetical protein